MSRNRILTYVILCISLGFCFKLYFDSSAPREIPLPPVFPETEEITIAAYPKGYTLGTFDDRFGISKERFLQIVDEAKKVWENAAGRDLFHFRNDGLMKVNLVYDWREESLLKAKEQRTKIDENGSSFEMLTSEYERKSSTVEYQRTAYEEAAQAYKLHLDEYNARVARWNEGENRTESESQILQGKQKDLEKERSLVEPKGDSLKTKIDELNALGERITALAKRFNMEVELFNGAYVNQREFEKGVFDGRNIDIYEFDKEEDLRIALVHEFGHALGIEHVENPKSIMHRRLAVQDVNNIHLTAEDLRELLAKLK